ncbi:hypothetical protein EDD73_10219 [Heliophilum fasciatum]|uniref:Uncharacterized protein n=1 Tax=Heliophilum fasciatum TaxID=35700 RepID=A0A4R2RYM1_9FIRM|nr:hypothetical protein [Heliophilum fasciatum]TCP68624.1 hypothetical protein EDD73_10219 [Heliophilum fasciatum]
MSGYGFFGRFQNVAGLVITLIVIGAFFPSLFCGCND